MRLIKHSPALLVALYGISAIGFFVVRWQVGATTPVALVNLMLPVLLIPALILLPLCLLWRRVRLALLLMPAVLAFALDYGPLFIPNRPTIDSDAPQLTLATFNLGARTENLDALIDVIGSLDTDVIALQEVSREVETLIETELAQAYPHRALHTVESPYFGYGILSRLPISDDVAYPREPGRLRLQRVVLTVDGQAITLFNFHAQPITESWRPADVAIRSDQVRFVVEAITQVTGPRLLLGDFNLNEQAEDYRRITAQVTDTFYEVGAGLGFTGPDWLGLELVGISQDMLAWLPPYQRIDYIFHDDHFQSVAARVWPTGGGSDHRPLLGDLALVS